ncbi:uncharacterized protein LOC131677809 [Topomyia yanbarensis]|uniref:uncharacterized protein LOC131677809 n=1 Tax=Topomyia yanbarensis TaxID=2498891 RepID=UPI00273C26F1|nr:uncharacterized protein LOC131677809 [Topomyia yanbarensis]
MPFQLESTTEELRATVHVHFESSNAVLPANNYSNWRHLVRVTAYVLRFADIRGTRTVGVLTSKELRRAEQFHYRTAQHDSYRDDLAILTAKDQKNTISKRSPLYKLNPFVDADGILRMRGRTINCEYVPMEVKCPIILPRDHAVTKLVVESYHQKFHHRNNETVINEIRQRFSIYHLRRVYSKVRTDCQRCKIRTALPRPPAMADLPRCRLAAFTRPFTHTGVDYFGPMEVAVRRRLEKRWGVLLTCLTVRAIHIEVASSLNTASCIMALRNFMSRRGTPAVFYSDRGTNFIGAERELKVALREVDQDAMMQEMVSSSTSWCFNSPASPHMGGSWERLIQTVKRTLSEFNLSRRPTDEELRNALIEVEGIINTRPLTHVPIEDEAAPALTPNHWLLGTSNGSKPLTLLNDNSVALRRGWHVSQMLANRFWRRWLQDYLPEITGRSKWHQRVKPIREGDIVLIADPDLPRNCWPKGRVIGTVNRDGQVRRVTIQTNRGVYERPAVKVAVLDVKSKEELANLKTELPNWGGVSSSPSSLISDNAASSAGKSTR